MANFQAWHIETYSANVTHRAQESRASLENATVVEFRASGESVAFPLMEPTEGEDYTARFGRTPNHSPDMLTRIAFPTMWVNNQMVDRLDQLRSFWDIQSNQVIAGSGSYNRVRHRRFITAATGEALQSVDNSQGGTRTLEPFPTAQIIPHGGAGINKSKIAIVRSNLDHQDGGESSMDEMDFALYDPLDLQTLIGEAEFNSLDSVSRQQIMMGRPAPGLFGFIWIPTKQLPTVNGIRRNLFWSKTGMGRADIGGRFERAGERSDLNYAKQVYLSQMVGYVRIDDAKVWAVEVDTNQIVNLRP